MAVLPTGIGPVTGGYQIERSLRFNSADSAYLNRTPGSAGNRRTWTWSGWVKRSGLGTQQELFHAHIDGSNFTSVRLNADDTISVFNALSGSTSNGFTAQTSAVFRDVSAWYHFVFFVDTTQSTVGNAVKIYVNNVQQTLGSSSYGGGTNQNTAVNSTVAQEIGRKGVDGNANFVNGYLTEVNFIDGSALTPSDFGETDSATGVWKPKAYTGTYGTNGFFLKFADNSNTTAATLGKDSSANGNNWTPNNFSVTAGAGNDSLVDSPTAYGTDTGVGGEVRGNYGTWNPLNKIASGSTLSNGNLTVAQTTDFSSVTGTVGVSSGKYYVEYTFSGSTVYGEFGFNDGTLPPYGNTAPRGANYVFYASFESLSSKQYRWTGGSSSTATNYITNTSVLGIAIDCDAGKVWFSINGTFQDSGNPATGANPNGTFTAGATMFPFFNNGTSITVDLNCGQRAFAYTAPSGFKALVTTNLPTPTIGATSTTLAGNYFNPVLYTGNGSTQSITGVGFQPDWVWIKPRSAASSHVLFDSLRGALNFLSSNQTIAESSLANSLTSFDSNGFSLGSDSNTNQNTSTYVAWNWNAGGSNATNTSGTITSTVRANTTSGFSIVTYTGTGANATVGHGLGVAPQMVIAKDRQTANPWLVWHTGIAGTEYLIFNTTAAKGTLATVWNSTIPTSTVFSLGSDGNVNPSGKNCVAYCFAPVAGYSAFGSYTGNGSADGPFVYTGFRPKFILRKNASDTWDWHITDSSRNTYNAANSLLFPNLSNAEATNNVYAIDIVSNGFKIRSSEPYMNGSGNTFIYAAFAESPFKYSLAR